MSPKKFAAWIAFLIAFLIFNLAIADLFILQPNALGKESGTAIGFTTAIATNQTSETAKDFQFAAIPGNLSANNPSMKITFRRSGGIAGRMTGCQIDTASLSSEETTKLQSLIQQSGLLHAETQYTPNARDLINYKITIQTGKNTHSVCWDELSLPAAAKPLIDYLQRRSAYENSAG